MDTVIPPRKESKDLDTMMRSQCRTALDGNQIIIFCHDRSGTAKSFTTDQILSVVESVFFPAGRSESGPVNMSYLSLHYNKLADLLVPTSQSRLGTLIRIIWRGVGVWCGQEEDGYIEGLDGCYCGFGR